MSACSFSLDFWTELIAGGDKHLYYAQSADLFADPLGMSAVNPPTDDPTVGGCHLSDLGMRKQAAYWAGAIPKFMAESSRKTGLQSGIAGTTTPTPLSAAQLTAEHEASEAALRRIKAALGPAGWETWGAIEHVPVTTPSSGIKATGAAVVDGESFVRGRPFPGAKRNNSYDRFPLKYAPTCPCHGGQPCACGLRFDVWGLSEMSTGEYLRFATDAEEIHVDWHLRAACAEKWFAGCHLWHMPDSGTNGTRTSNRRCV